MVNFAEIAEKYNKTENFIKSLHNAGLLKQFIAEEDSDRRNKVEQQKLKEKIEKTKRKVAVKKAVTPVKYAVKYICYHVIDVLRYDYLKAHMKHIRCFKYQDKYYEQNSEVKNATVLSKQIKNFNNSTVYRFYTPERFVDASTILKEDKDFKDLWDLKAGYIDAIALQKVYELKDDKDAKKRKLEDINLFNSFDNQSICHKYIEYTQLQNAQSFDKLFNHQASNESIQQNQRANSCFYNIIIETYKPCIDKLVDKHEYKEYLTLSSLIRILGVKPSDQDRDLGLSISGATPFFDKYKVGLCCMDAYGKIFYEYKPDIYNKKVSPRTLYILVINNHCFKLNSSIESLAKSHSLEQNKDNDIEENLKVSDKVYIKQKPKEEQTHFVNNIDDIVKVVNSYDCKEENNVKLLFNDVWLEDLLVEMKFTYKYTPEVCYVNSSIASISFKLEKTKFNIIKNSMTDGITSIYSMSSIDEYKQYYDADYKLYSKLMNKNHLSTFNNDTVKIIDSFPYRPLCCKLCPNELDNLNAVDMNKSYTDNLTHMKCVPVYNMFDIWQQYDNHDIEDYTQYLVTCNDNTTES